VVYGVTVSFIFAFVEVNGLFAVARVLTFASAVEEDEEEGGGEGDDASNDASYDGAYVGTAAAS
jgi:hypothetical protein